MTIKVLIADDQPVVRKGFGLFLRADPDIAVVGEASTGEAGGPPRPGRRRWSAHWL